MLNKSPIIAFTAGKGGCGKTTLAINFAYNIFKAKNKVLVVDFDLSNRGSSGIFSNYLKNEEQKNYITLTDLLNSSLDKTNIIYPLVDIQDNGYYFLPASHVGEDIKFEIYEQRSLENLVTLVKTKLDDIAVKNKIDCIVLDCFCGIDILTTTGICVSNDAVFINEADIVTFTGTIYLHRHILKQFELLPPNFPKPSIHLIINRLKSEFSVKELNSIYEKNLVEEFENVVECHFPYNERIFKNFGKYPFWEDLLPGSLFVKKMNLLCWKIFSIENKRLLKKDVQRWSKEKAVKVYFQSKDYNAIDTETLLLEFTDLITYGGFLLGTYFLINYYIKMGPFLALLAFLTLLLLTLILYCRKLIWPMFLNTKLNFSIAAFQYRLKKYTGRLSDFFSTLIYFRFLTSTMMTFSTLTIVVGLFFMMRLVYNKFDLKHISSLGEIVTTTIPKAAIRDSTFFEKMDISNSHLVNIDLTDSLNSGLKYRDFSNSRFSKCVITLTNFNDRKHFKNITADSSVIIKNTDNDNYFYRDFASLFASRNLSFFSDLFFNSRSYSKPSFHNTVTTKIAILSKIGIKEQKYRSLKNVLVLDTLVPLSFPWKTNYFVSAINYYHYGGDRKSFTDIVIFNTPGIIRNINYQFDPKQHYIFYNCKFDEKINLKDYTKKHLNVTVSDSSKHQFAGKTNADSLLFHLSKELLSNPAPKIIIEQCKNLDNSSIADLTELEILLGDRLVNGRINAYLTHLGSNDIKSKEFKRSLFLRLLWQVTQRFPEAAIDTSFNKWINWCNNNMIKLSTNKDIYDSWSWNTWNNYSKETLTLSASQIKFIEALRTTELDFYHYNTNVSKEKIQKDIYELNIAYKNLNNM